MNNKKNGFTMIELLTVITIMGLLLLITVPAVSGIIENARKDSFVVMTSDYLEAVENNVTSENLVCYSNSNNKQIPISTTKDGTYFFPICTSNNCESVNDDISVEDVVNNTKELFDNIKKSPFGDAELQGYVVWTKKTTGTGKDKMTSINYKIRLQDMGWRGFEKDFEKNEIKILIQIKQVKIIILNLIIII